MKRIILTFVITGISLFSIAQPGSDENRLINDSSVTTTAILQDRIAKLEAEVKELKSSYKEINQQVVELKRKHPDLKKKKLEVNRVSSKGAKWVEE